MDKNAKTMTAILGVVAVMIGLSFASVPLYNVFCRVTGFGGTTQRSDKAPDEILDRTITVKFNADTAPDMPWTFKPEQHEMTVKLGQQGLASFLSHNKESVATAGTAIYNVTPEKIGKYFHKIQCFCFSNQTLAPGQTMHMPVVFYIDPAMDKDRALDDVTTVTLSYTFYPADSPALDKAIEGFYNAP